MFVAYKSRGRNGAKSWKMGNNFKLIYNRTKSNQNSIGIAVDKYFQERIVEVKRISDRILMVKFVLDDQSCMNVITAHAPQIGLPQAKKQLFWDDL